VATINGATRHAASEAGATNTGVMQVVRWSIFTLRQVPPPSSGSTRFFGLKEDGGFFEGMPATVIGRSEVIAAASC
jgi:hypothetical protein